MQENKPNLFPIVAVLTAASVLTGVCGLLFLAIDQMGTSRVLSTPLDQNLEDSLQGEALSTPFSAANLPSQIVGKHRAAVLSVEVLDAEVLDLEGLGTETSTARGAASDVASSGNNILVASGGYDNTATIWPMNNLHSKRQSLQPLKRTGSGSHLAHLAHSGRVNALAFIPAKDVRSTDDFSNGSSKRFTAARLVTGSGSGEIRLWSVPTGDIITTIADQSGRVVSMAADASGNYFASGTSEGTLKVWPVDAIAAQKSQTSLRGIVLNNAGPQMSALAFHPTDEGLLVSGDDEGRIKIWDIASASSILTLSSGASRIVSVAVSPDGRYLASGSEDRLIRIWNIASGQLTQTLSGHGSVVSDIAFSPDGNLLASSSYDESIKTWDWANAKERCTLEGHSGIVHTVAFADESTLVSGGYDGTVRRWNLAAPINSDCSN